MTSPLSEVQRRKLEIEAMELNEEEIKEAIREAKIKKHNREKFAPYWEEKLKEKR